MTQRALSTIITANSHQGRCHQQIDDTLLPRSSPVSITGVTEQFTSAVSIFGCLQCAAQKRNRWTMAEVSTTWGFPDLMYRCNAAVKRTELESITVKRRVWGWGKIAAVENVERCKILWDCNKALDTSKSWLEVQQKSKQWSSFQGC